MWGYNDSCESSWTYVHAVFFYPLRFDCNWALGEFIGETFFLFVWPLMNDMIIQSWLLYIVNFCFGDKISFINLVLKFKMPKDKDNFPFTVN